MKGFGSATWNGDLHEGKGSVSTESGALETYPYTFFSRYDEKPGTNPEELLGAAHAAVSPCRSSDYSAWRTSCRSKSTANRKSSSTRTALAFPSPRSILPSPRRYLTSTRPRSSQSPQKQGRLPCLQTDEGRNWLRGHSPLVKSRRVVDLTVAQIAGWLRRARTQRINAIGTS